LISSAESIDAILRDGGWPTKEDLADYLSFNPDVDDPYTIAIPDVAYSADEARKIWKEKQNDCANKLGVCIALLDHDMPGESGLELAGYFQEVKEKGMAVPVIIFYTGKAALLEEALESDGYKQKIVSIASTGLAEAVLQKGASNEEFNELIWAAIKKSVHDIKRRDV
jgi:CheY-like chemotaxis protein